MRFLYVAQGKSGLLKIGSSKNMQQRTYEMRARFKKLGDEMARIESFGPLRDARLCEYWLHVFVGQTSERHHAGREWFIGGDYDLAVAEGRRLLENAASHSLG